MAQRDRHLCAFRYGADRWIRTWTSWAFFALWRVVGEWDLCGCVPYRPSQLHLLADLPENGNVRFPLCQYSLPLCCWRSVWWRRLCHKRVFTQGRKFTQYDVDSLCLAFHFCPAQQLLAQGHFHFPCSLLLLVKENCGLDVAWKSILDSVLFNVLTGVFRAFHSATMVDGNGICIVRKTDDVTVSITTGWHTWYDRRIF